MQLAHYELHTVAYQMVFLLYMGRRVEHLPVLEVKVDLNHSVRLRHLIPTRAGDHAFWKMSSTCCDSNVLLMQRFDNDDDVGRDILLPSSLSETHQRGSHPFRTTRT